MPDRYDPKLSLRPGGSRRPAEPRRDGAGQEDPLAELAKLVSGRSGGSGQSRARPAPVRDPVPASGGDPAGDLETELLNDLQASFAAVREMVAAPSPQAAPEPQAVPEPPPRRTEPELRRQTEPEPTRPPDPEPPASADPAPFDTELLPAGLAERLAPAPPPSLFTLSDLDGAEDGEPAEAHEPRSTAIPADFAEAPPPARGTNVPGFTGFQRRSTGRNSESAPPPAAPPARSRWEPEAAKPVSATVSRFAPPPSAAQPPKAPAFDDDDDPFADLAGVEDDEAPNEFPLEGFGDLQVDDEGDLDDAPYPDGDLASMIEPRRSRTPLLVGSVIGLVLIGGIAVAMFRPGDSGANPPPVIVADGLPTRITPDETALAEADAQNKLIYDRLNPGEENGDTTLLTPADEPIAALPSDNAFDNPISRVIIPGGPGFDDPPDEGLSLSGEPSVLPEDAQVAAAEDDTIEAIGPRRVRTVIVKPDGTIVESAASDAGAEDAAEAPAEAVAVPALSDAPPTITAVPPPTTDDTVAISGNASGELTITPVPEIGGNTAVANDPPALPTPDPPPAQVAAADTNAPIDLGESPPIPAGGMLVQVSSQRSEDAARATFRDLQARYPNILGRYDVNIQRADIPGRGIFFRVRVGPFSAGDAERLCNDLKTAGGDCILAQR